MTTADVHGICAPGFEGVREEFARCFTERGDIGAAVRATVDGETVVDLWGGTADAEGLRPWRRDTLVTVYSTTKGLTALCAHVLADRGALDLDAPVAAYWPEFAQEGKADIPVRWLLGHRAGLIAPREPLTVEEVHDWDRACAAIAATRPWWEPGTAAGYHGMTFGFLVGEVVRRVSGQSLGTFLRTEIAQPLGVDLFIGTPASEHGRCADMVGHPDLSRVADTVPGAPRPPVTSMDAHPMAPVVLALGHMPFGEVNSAAFRSAEIPATNAFATARGLAAVYGALANGTLVGEGTLEALRTRQGAPGDPDLVLGDGGAWALGFKLNEGGAGPNPRAFGHAGAGGSYAFADPENRVSYAYTMNRYVNGGTDDDRRSDSLVRALYAALGQRP
ncbi:class A beta-lactamase-related serine hydrolase [Streptomyces sp. WAC05374]|uniref:serine hydrolase domain-containing protein n=1 Tax=Streptomyces sp. WAC05374 TaxID=2487420 RepID=UPI000F89513D|nr:serine hydrolase domain-containing protein [Streptomyces sp. WAC05374]RST15559.1 class A beta-lactamase-related serine hydrolase [Streptomyces sp. WAC05374]TDF50292.1 class A beta-lactamase-related serine hydrolase [Streptomyces sp. WAC05374]TDF58016.1 class A beta-lactamase-related serine hydrolase [Streptomyces sp. WAC05374]TDF60544.1 class A beta-lactamase-related serine hydrolase [Streptomyces sp. WAC05374]